MSKPHRSKPAPEPMVEGAPVSRIFVVKKVSWELAALHLASVWFPPGTRQLVAGKPYFVVFPA